MEQLHKLASLLTSVRPLSVVDHYIVPGLQSRLYYRGCSSMANVVH